MTVKVTAKSEIHNLPLQMATRVAAQTNGGGQSGGRGGRGGGGAGANGAAGKRCGTRGRGGRTAHCWSGPVADDGAIARRPAGRPEGWRCVMIVASQASAGRIR